MRDKTRHNPLILDDNYEKLFDDDFIDPDHFVDDRDLYDVVSHGGRRRKPLIETDD